MQISQVWTEKYKPLKIEDVLLSEKEKEKFLSFTEIPNNLLFVGNSGIGKSTVAKLLAKKFSPNSYLFLNASEQGSIETVRSIISDFVSVCTIDGSQKIVILDEADGISLVAQQALRAIMEENLDSVKFILTANYKNKLIEALISRCQEFDFSCTEKQVLQRIVYILKSEQINVAKENLEDIKNLVKEHFPDVRKTINELQSCCISGVFVKKKTSDDSFARRVKAMLHEKKDVFEIRQFVVDNTDQFNNNFHSLMRDLFHLYVRDRQVTACVLVSEYMHRHSSVLDAEVNFCALLFNLSQKLK